MAQEGLLAHIHIIMVSSGRGIKARVGRRRHLPQIRHGNIGRQQAIEFIGHPIWVCDGRFHIKVGHHAGSMNARIGATSTCRVNLCAQKGGQCAIQLLLHRRCIWLHLPTMIGSAVIGEAEKIAGHG